MKINKEQVQAALAAGIALTNPESETAIPMKHAAGAVILHQVLLSIASGQTLLQDNTTPEILPDPMGHAGKAPASGKK